MLKTFEWLSLLFLLWRVNPAAQLQTLCMWLVVVDTLSCIGGTSLAVRMQQVDGDIDAGEF